MSLSVNKKFLKSIGSYTLVNIINKGIPFLLLPILTNYLSKEDYGVITNIESLIVISVALIGVNYGFLHSLVNFDNQCSLFPLLLQFQL
jgi:O-antigen/teichoic acid export membrane protein